MQQGDYDELGFFFDRVCNDYHNNPGGLKVHKTNWSLKGVKELPANGKKKKRRGETGMNGRATGNYYLFSLYSLNPLSLFVPLSLFPYSFCVVLTNPTKLALTQPYKLIVTTMRPLNTKIKKIKQGFWTYRSSAPILLGNSV